MVERKAETQNVPPSPSPPLFPPLTLRVHLLRWRYAESKWENWKIVVAPYGPETGVEALSEG